MNRWQRRIERAQELASAVPQSAELLRFYAAIASLQSDRSRDTEKLKDVIRRNAPGGLGKMDDAVDAFCARVLLQADTEERAHSARIDSGVQPLCPFCGEKPVAAVLRPEGDGGKRFLLCSLCYTEWEFRRLLCANCGEEDRDKLPVFSAEEFPYIRIEVCDSCHAYLKAIDLTKNGRAVPEVDELASATLDFWADEHGYTKVQVNVLGL